MGSGQWAVGSGQWTVGSGQWAVGSGQSAVDSGQSAVGSRQWAVDSRQWAVGSPEEMSPEDRGKRPEAAPLYSSPQAIPTLFFVLYALIRPSLLYTLLSLN